MPKRKKPPPDLADLKRAGEQIAERLVEEQVAAALKPAPPKPQTFMEALGALDHLAQQIGIKTIQDALAGRLPWQQAAAPAEETPAPGNQR